MPKVKSAIARVGKLHWSWIGAAVSLVIVALAAITLLKLLHALEPAKVLAALRAFPPVQLAIAGCCVVGSYLALTLYDVFALRTIGRAHVPYRVAAFASFTSYTIGHNFGATVFTSGVVRFRVYSAWGLTLIDIAKIAFVTGLTFWLGNAFVLGAGLTYAPAAASALDTLPAWSNRLIGLAALGALALYLGWLLPRPRIVGRSDWRLALPSARWSLVQIGTGSLDLACVALAMYTLLPANPTIAFPAFLVVFILSLFLGVVSYVPGSLGVIEAAMFLGLPQYPKEDLLASLLVFRLLNFVLPLTLAASLYGVHECWNVMRRSGNKRDRLPPPQRSEPQKRPAR